MFAIIESMGRQYKVAVGDVIRVDLIAPSEEDAPTGSEIIFNQVLMTSDEEGSATNLGKPYIAGATVTGELVCHGQEKKVIAFKKKRRQGYHRKVGFRRQYTEIKIKDIKAA